MRPPPAARNPSANAKKPIAKWSGCAPNPIAMHSGAASASRPIAIPNTTRAAAAKFMLRAAGDPATRRSFRGEVDRLRALAVGAHLHDVGLRLVAAGVDRQPIVVGDQVPERGASQVVGARALADARRVALDRHDRARNREAAET